MTDNIIPEDNQAEIAMLNHEIYELQKQLKEKEKEHLDSIMLDENDPFCNPTEYKDYSGNYSDIVPQIKLPGCRMPVEPGKREKQRLRHFYNIGGTCILLHFLFSVLFSFALTKGIMMILSLRNPDVSNSALYRYAYRSAIMISVSAVTYMIANVLFSFIGLKWSKLGTSSLTKTREFSFGKAVQYCLCAIFIQYAASICSALCDNVMQKYGYHAEIDNSGFATTTAAVAVLAVYQCIIAPITEELFYRGVVLKIFARANQRFAVFASAFFFGLAHGNIPQFMLAFILGTFLAHIDIKHNSILPSVIVHIFVNTAAMILNHFIKSGSTSEILTMNIVYLMVAGAGLILFVCFSRKNKIPRTTPQQSRRGFAVAKTSVPVIMAFAAMAFEMVINVLYN